jgi:hypothetical protein
MGLTTCVPDGARIPGREDDGAMNVKKLILLVGALFIAFWLFQDPQGLADVASTFGEKGWDVTQQLFESVISFVSTISS